MLPILFCLIGLVMMPGHVSLGIGLVVSGIGLGLLGRALGYMPDDLGNMLSLLAVLALAMLMGISCYRALETLGLLAY